MIAQIFRELHRWFAPPTPPPRQPDPSRPFGMVQHWADTNDTLEAAAAKHLPPSDGRLFVWIRVRGASFWPLQAQIIFDKSAGPKLEIAVEHLLSPSEYGDDLNTLMARYPAPTVILDLDT